MVGAAVPEDVMAALMDADPCPQIQTHKLSCAVIRGLEGNGQVIDLISTVPIADYPRSKWLWSGYRKWDRSNGSNNRLVRFINIIGLKQLTRFLGCIVMLLCWSIAHRRQKRRVLLYGLISAHLYAVLTIRLFFPATTVALVTDLPGLGSSSEPWWRRIARPLDRSVVHRAMRSMDGLIVLARQIDFAPRVPSIVVEGIVSVESQELAKATHAQGKRTKEFIVLYAGALGQIYGIPMLLDAFRELAGEDFRLHLFGRGDMEDEIRRRMKTDCRISFSEQMVSTQELFYRSQQATVLMNPRPSRQQFSRYSFPSKVLEYMAAGRPVVSTRIPVIPAEYDPYLIWLDQETSEGLAALLRRLHKEPPEFLDGLGRRARDFVLEKKTCRRQGGRMLQFIRHLDRT